MAEAKKPRGFGAFEQALRKVTSVDKAAVDKAVAAKKARRIRERKKK